MSRQLGGHKVSDTLELEFKVFAGYLICMLGTELGSSEKEVLILNPLSHPSNPLFVFQDKVSLELCKPG